ncbi:RagB/SusD family nutrient uptake outer membrane protein [Robertkochia solimangrovi]|uniref:RagB/SusD family nutrient uptake outer membrane protein n=1 Tax=Robertkochia solimangrovi TaxID=2213046 RepID=UPI001F54B980|nr:RagB/SusD family nutrient uptake outer membrane protein [Robertkochia solimangrovi]
MKTNKINIALFCFSFLGVVSCTDLEIEQTDSRFTNLTGEFTGVDPAQTLTNLYNSVRSQVENQENIYALNEVATDEFVVPTRGTDWGDNGVWRTLHSHTWDANHQRVKNTWNDQNQNVYNATTIIDSRSNGSPAEVAEAKFLRAYSMFWLIDLYGQVPFRNIDDAPDVLPMVMSRADAFDFAVKDLEEAIPNLEDKGPNGGLDRAGKAAARLLLAKYYLNKHIFTGSGSPAAEDMTKVVQLVDDIQDQGYALHDGYFDIFTSAADNETIFFTTGSVGNRMWNGLHYNQNSPDNTGGGWNGFSTIAEFYDLFEGDPNTNVPGSGQEERRGFVPTDGSHLGIGYGFLIGQQYDANGNKMKDRPGNDLIFTKELPGLLGNDERDGIRVIKWHPENGAFAGHEIVMRYADAHLMKVEAIFNGGSSSEDALTLMNELRTIRKATPLSSLSAQDIIDERGRELYGESWRRNDLIRFGQFISPWSYKEVTGDETKNLFPIPATAIISNPNLIQNPGY